ncbi:hypothetical protein TREES_T100003867 [Tupaia chinensis]|uniref:Uncharacterized protein n=1 Tax=Tupaia chinensis TaxID=246437 RepID=L9KZM4_TUPCH|nr:hypothetical protein TREES_T100003867 [Tupaia chinensis]
MHTRPTKTRPAPGSSYAAVKAEGLPGPGRMAWRQGIIARETREPGGEGQRQKSGLPRKQAQPARSAPGPSSTCSLSIYPTPGLMQALCRRDCSRQHCGQVWFTGASTVFSVRTALQAGEPLSAQEQELFTAISTRQHRPLPRHRRRGQL